MKKLSKIIITLLVLLTSINVYADSVIDFSKKGSINVEVTDSSSSPVSGMEITLFKVANAGVENHNLVYSNIEELNSCKVDFTIGDEKSISTEAVNCVKENATYNKTTITNKNGKVSFKELDLAIYLVVQTKKVEGLSSFEPFLIMIPQSEKNNWKYDIDSTPKTDIYHVMNIEVLKEWNNEGKANPDSIEVELLENNEVIDIVTLNDNNNWSYTWVEIPKSDSYSVREKEVPSEYEVTYRNEDNKFIITNTRKIPQTGMRTWVIELLAISGMVLLTIGLVNRKNEEI